MAVPKQVKKQTEAVQKLYADLEVDPNASPENGEVVEPANEDPAPEVTPLADSVSEPAPSPEPAGPGDGTQEESFEQKYRSLQGMYNSEVPRLNAQNQELAQRLEQMEQLIASIQAAPATPPVAEPTAPPASLITDEEREEYGESLDIMRKVSQEVAAAYQGRIDQLESVIANMQGTVMPRVEQLASQQAHTAEQAFWSDLTIAVPEWRTTNENPDFQSWLLEVDPLSGLPRQTYLDDAQRNLDAIRVASFFTSWGQVNGTVTPKPNRTAPNSELEKQVAPGRGRTSATPPGNAPVTYTPADITAFFKDVQLGKFKDKEEERDKIERDIFAAQQDGRIVQA